MNDEKNKTECACPACSCIVDIINAVKDKAGNLFCSNECAEGHVNDKESKKDDNNSCNCGCNCG